MNGDRSSYGNQYAGNCLNGHPHGKGKRTWQDVFVKEGEWINGELV
jgi:hypothetical protein